MSYQYPHGTFASFAPPTVQEVYLNRANCISVCLTVDEVYLNQMVLLVDGTQVVYL